MCFSLGATSFRARRLGAACRGLLRGADPPSTWRGVASEGLYRVEHEGHGVTWVTALADSLKKRLLVSAHLEGPGDVKVDVTIARLGRHPVWEGMADDVRDMIRPCLYCEDT